MMQTREQKPVYTFVDGMAASAAYWLAASSDRIYSSLSAELGGVGVYLPVLDQSKAFEARGMKMHVIKAGRYKAIGFPGTKLTEDQEFHLQESVNQVYSEFKDHVQSNRQIDADNLEGQTFSGRNTFDKGFSDEQASSLLEVINATQPSIIEEE
jgi:ClpP class serine protease